MTRWLWTVLVLAAFSPVEAWAQNADRRLFDAAACSTITDSLQRLVCFDRVFPADAEGVVGKAGDSEQEPVAAADYGLWEVEETKSPIDDSPKILAYMKSSDQRGFAAFSKGIVLRCMENTTSVVVTTDTFAIGSNSGQITARIDDQPATVARWDMATDGRSVGLWNGATAIPFLRSIREAGKLAMRVELNQRTDLIFEDVRGVAAVVDRIADACNWPAP